MLLWTAFLSLFTTISVNAFERHLELLDYVQEAPDQGHSGTCLYVAATGAMELLANKREGIRNPIPYGKYDLSESFLIHAPSQRTRRRLYFWEEAFHRFNISYGIPYEEWPFEAWDGAYTSNSVWRYRSWSRMNRVQLPGIETVPLFAKGRNRWSTRVLSRNDITKMKRAIDRYNSPLIVNYNDYGFWHTALIVGYDDELPGSCYDLSANECGDRQGAFYVRDSFGRRVEVRDYDWFRIRGNAAFVAKEK